MNKENIKKLISLIIEGSGDNHARDGLKGTPERVANLYEELFSGYKKEIKAFQIGGPLGGVVPMAEIDNLNLDFQDYSK